MMAAILVRAGCMGEGATWRRPIEEFPTDQSPAVVIKNHIVPENYAMLEERGYVPITLIMVRHPVAAIGSMVRWGHDPSEREARDRLSGTLKQCVCNARGEWYVIPYESLCGPDSAEASTALCRMLDLPDPHANTVVVEGEERPLENQNHRYWEP